MLLDFLQGHAQFLENMNNADCFKLAVAVIAITVIRHIGRFEQTDPVVVNEGFTRNLG
ncbi:hypothetical protein D3C75_1290640 [compost metagenome]